MFVADLVARKFYLYYSIWYFDIIMHALGGIWLGSFFVYVFSRKNKIFPSALKVILSVLSVGLLWEIFEFITNSYIGGGVFHIVDTSSDLFFDLVGGTFAVFYCSKKFLSKEEVKLN